MAKIGIVLSGGILKGAYQAGALKAVSEVIDIKNIKYISAASIGALNAFAFASDIIDTAIRLWGEVESLKKNSIIDIFKGEYTGELINSISQNRLKHNMDVYIPLFNVPKLKLEYINISNVTETLLTDYLKASISLPPFQSAVKINGNSYIDGAIIDNIPFKAVQEKSPDYIICIYFDKNNYIFENESFDKKVIRLNYSDNTFIKSSISLKNSNIKEMIDAGYNESLKLMSALFKNGLDDIDYILAENSKLNIQSGQSTYRITGDVIVNNLNKALSKIIPKYYRE